jgi:hypothetical protein
VTRDTHVGLGFRGWLDCLVFILAFSLACSSRNPPVRPQIRDLVAIRPLVLHPSPYAFFHQPVMSVPPPNKRLIVGEQCTVRQVQPPSVWSGPFNGGHVHLAQDSLYNSYILLYLESANFLIFLILFILHLGRPEYHRLVWATLKTDASSSAILDRWNFLSYCFAAEPPYYFGTNRKLMKRPSYRYLGECWGTKFDRKPSISPPQSTDDAASDSFWTPPPRNSYRPQFGTASPITIPLIYSWYGPLVRIVSTFTF